MPVEDDLITALKTMSAVTALVGSGTSARIRTDDFERNETLPAVLIEVDEDTPQNDLTGRGGLTYSDVTVTCRASTISGSRALAEAVKFNGAIPGTGLCGKASAAFDSYLDHTESAVVYKDDGTNVHWYDTLLSFVVSYPEQT